jgi:hypothetical protein
MDSDMELIQTLVCHTVDDHLRVELHVYMTILNHTLKGNLVILLGSCGMKTEYWISSVY